MSMLYDLLRDYQKKAVHNVLESLKTSNATCLIQAPNTGKTLEALSIAEILNEKTLYITISNDIIHQAKENIKQFHANVDMEFITYHKLMRLSERKLRKLPKVLFIDECQHVEAPEFKKPIDYLESIHPDLKKIGLTATPIRDYDYTEYIDEEGNNIKEKKDVVHERFNDNVAFTYKLEEALNDGIIAPPTYIRVYHVLKNTVKDYEKKFLQKYHSEIPEDVKQLLNKLATYSKQEEEILKKYVTKGKVLVFCSNIAELKKTTTHYQMLYPEATILEYHSGQTKKEQHQAMKKIRSKRDGLIFFFVVDKFSEGIHFPSDLSFDTGIFLRPTKSYRIFVQHLGRLLGLKNVLILDFVDRISETGMEKLYYQFVNLRKERSSEEKNIDLNDFQIIEECIEIKEIMQQLDRRFYLTFLERLEYVQEFVKQNPKITISTAKERFPDGTIIGPWWCGIVSKFVKRMKETPFEMQTEEDRTALYILAQIDEMQGNTLDFIGKLLYVKKMVEHDPKIAISTTGKRFLDETIIGPWWCGIVSKFVKQMKETPFEMQTEEDRTALYILAQIDEMQGNALDFISKLLYVKKIIEHDPKIAISTTKKRFPDGTVIGSWWIYKISKFVKQMKETPFEMQTEEDKTALYILAQIDEMQGNTLDFIGKLLYVKKMVEHDPKIAISTIEERFLDGTIIGPWWCNTVSKFVKQMKETSFEAQTEEDKMALYILAQIDEMQGNTLDFIGKLLYVKKMVEHDPKIAISTTKKRFPDGTVIGSWWLYKISKFVKQMKQTPFETQTEEDKMALYILAQIDEMQGDTLDFIGKLLYVKKIVEHDPQITISKIKERFPDGTVIGSWWLSKISKYVKKMKETSFEAQTEEDNLKNKQNLF